MAVSVSTPADMVNLSLARIGFKGRVGNLYEGSEAAKKALDIYAQTRDAVLREKDWGFAGRDVQGTLLKQAPEGGYIPPNVWNNTYPMLPWLFQYQYPSDALRIRTVKQSPIFLPVIDPQPQIFAVENDQTYSPPQKVVLCNLSNAIILYTAQVTDPQAWEADFIESFAAALGRRLAPVLKDLDAAKFASADEQAQGLMSAPKDAE